MAEPFIPEQPEQLTAEWLTGVLLERGILKSAKVIAVDREPIGDGEGFLGVVTRLTLTLDREEPGVPKTLIAKLPTTVKENRVMAELIGAYRREILFYEELAEQVPMRLPVTYLHQSARAGGRDREPVEITFDIDDRQHEFRRKAFLTGLEMHPLQDFDALLRIGNFAGESV